MSVLWFVVFVTVLVGYLLLEGAVIGVGATLPLLGRSSEARGRIVSRIGPMMLLSEVWLVAIGGLLFGIYPYVEGEVLSALYPLVLALLTCWVVRDAGVWFRARGGTDHWRLGCDAMVCGGSLGLAASWSLVLGALFSGLSGSLVTPAGLLLIPAMAIAFATYGIGVSAHLLRVPESRELVRRHAWAGQMYPMAVLLAVAAVTALAPATSHLLAHTSSTDTLLVLTVFALPCYTLVVAVQWWGLRWMSRNIERAESTRRSFF